MLIRITYYLSSLLIAFGIFLCISSRSYLSRLLGLGIMQSGVIVFVVTIGKVFNAPPPILLEGQTIYSNIVPQVLMLTAIVVGIATFAIGIALIFKIRKNFDTMDVEIIEENKKLESRDEIH